MEFQRANFWKKWEKKINKSKTILNDGIINNIGEIIIPFIDKKNKVGKRKISKNIYKYCIENNVDVHNILYISPYDGKKYKGLHILFDF
jgi:hypothetical protein